MARTGAKRKRVLSPDPIYGNVLVARFTNRLMKSGKKGAAQAALYQAFGKIEQQKADPITIFETAIRNVSPRMEVRPRRVGGASYQVPMEVRGTRRESLAIRWIIAAALARPSREYKTMANKLAQEFLDAANNQGAAVKKKDDIHRMADSNRAFAHFRW